MSIKYQVDNVLYSQNKRVFMVYMQLITTKEHRIEGDESLVV
jgi:hypothetical protein